MARGEPLIRQWRLLQFLQARHFDTDAADLDEPGTQARKGREMASRELYRRKAKPTICRKKSQGLQSALQQLILACLVVLTLSVARAGETDVRVLNGFSDDAECARFKMGVKAELVEEHVTEGKKAAKFIFPAGKEYAGFSVSVNNAGTGREVLARWGDYDYFVFDVFNPNGENIVIDMRIDDDGSTNDWSTRSDTLFTAVPGANHFRLKTSRTTNNVQPWLKRNLDPNKLTRFALWLSPAPRTDTVLYFDNFSLAKNPKVDLPKTMRAFQFGSADSDGRPGFTAVHPRSHYSDETGYGFSDTANLAGLDDLFDREGLHNGDPLCGSGVYRPNGPLSAGCSFNRLRAAAPTGAGVTNSFGERARPVKGWHGSRSMARAWGTRVFCLLVPPSLLVVTAAGVHQWKTRWREGRRTDGTRTRDSRWRSLDVLCRWRTLARSRAGACRPRDGGDATHTDQDAFASSRTRLPRLA